MPLFYDELYKPVKNVLNTGYNSTTKFTVKTSPNRDLRLEATAERKSNQAIDAALKWTQSINANGIGYTVGGKLDVEGTVELNGSARGVAKGLDLGADATIKTDRTSKDNKYGVNATYRHNLVAIKAAVAKKQGSPYLLTTSAVSDYEGLSAGVEGELQVYPVPEKKDQVLKKVNFGLRYSTPNFHVTSLIENLENVKIGVAQTISPKLTLAGEFSHNVKPDAETGNVRAPVWTFGGNYVVDADSSVSGKVNTAGVVNASYKLRVNPSVTATLSVESNVNKLAEPSKVGLSVDIDA